MDSFHSAPCNDVYFKFTQNRHLHPYLTFSSSEGSGKTELNDKKSISNAY